MPLLQLFQCFEGGVANLIRQLSSEFNESKSYVGLFDTTGLENTDLRYNKIQIGHRDARSRIFFGWIKRYRDLKRAKKQLRIRVTLAHSPWLHALNIFTGGKDQKIFVIHGTVAARRSTVLEQFLFRIFFMLFDQSTFRYVVVSKELQLETLRWVRNPEKVVCILNAVDPEEVLSKCLQPLSPAIEEFIKGTKFFVSVGRLHPQKNFEFLIKLFARLKGSAPYAEYKLVLVGEGTLLNALIACAERVGLSVAVLGDGLNPLSAVADVLLTRFLPNPFPLVKLARAYISTSIYEGYPFAVCEAMVLNKKLILSDCPTGHVEIVNGSYSGNYCLGENIYGTLLPMRNGDPDQLIDDWVDYLLANAMAIDRSDDHGRLVSPEIYNNRKLQLSKWKEIVYDTQTQA